MDSNTLQVAFAHFCQFITLVVFSTLLVLSWKRRKRNEKKLDEYTELHRESLTDPFHKRHCDTRHHQEDLQSSVKHDTFCIRLFSGLAIYILGVSLYTIFS